MTLTVLGSGSSGNCYIVGDDEERILIDCGLPYKEILRGLNYNIMNISAVLVSHEHKDHIMSATNFSKLGIPVYSCESASHVCKGIASVSALKPFSAGKFDFVGFPLPHDETPNMGFLVRHPRMGSLLYMTDLAYSPYSFRGVHVNHMMVECNYCEANLDVNDSAYRHRINGHAGLKTTMGIIRANMTEDLKTVTIIHISKNYGDVDRMLNEVKSIVPEGVAVNAAIPQLVVYL